jgi:tight adherence protein C
VPEVSRFVNAVVQADSFGVPLSKVLHDQAEEARTRRRQRAEELARTAPVKMIFPMVLLIFPSLFIVILGPAVPRIFEIFASAR